MPVTNFSQTPQHSRLVVVIRGKQQPEDMRMRYLIDHVQAPVHDISGTLLGKKAVDLEVSRWASLGEMVLNHGISESVVKIANNHLNH